MASKLTLIFYSSVHGIVIVSGKTVKKSTTDGKTPTNETETENGNHFKLSLYRKRKPSFHRSSAFELPVQRNAWRRTIYRFWCKVWFFSTSVLVRLPLVLLLLLLYRTSSRIEKLSLLSAIRNALSQSFVCLSFHCLHSFFGPIPLPFAFVTPLLTAPHRPGRCTIRLLTWFHAYNWHVVRARAGGRRRLDIRLLFAGCVPCLQWRKSDLSCCSIILLSKSVVQSLRVTACST